MKRLFSVCMAVLFVIGAVAAVQAADNLVLATGGTAGTYYPFGGAMAETAVVVLSELGPDLSAFANEGRFVSYLRLAPNISISAGKKVPGKFKAVTSPRVSNALRMAATTLRNSKTALGAYDSRISWRKGASVAVFATARKLAQLVYRMIRYGQAYVDEGANAYEARCTQRRLRSYARALKDMGYKVEPLTV